MAETAVRFTVQDPEGALTLEGVLSTPDGAGPVAGVVVAHPHPLAGGDMDNNVVGALCEGLAAAGIASLRFNFRGVGESEGVHANGIGELEDLRAAFAFLQQQTAVDATRCGLAGYSFGARASLKVAASLPLRGLLVVAPPMGDTVAAAGTGPMMALVGSNDRAAGGDMAAYRAHLPQPDSLLVIPGTDHFWMGYEGVLADAAGEFFGKALAARA